MRVLKVFAAILFIVVIIEFFYLWSYSQGRRYTTNDTLPITPTPTISPTVQESEKYYLDIDQADSAVNYTVIETMKLLKPGSLESSTITNTFMGIVQTIDTDGGTIPNGYSYSVAISIMGDNSKSNNLIFTQSDLTNLLVQSKSASGVYTLINITDIMVGDTIRLVETFDLTKDWGNNILFFEITKLIN